VAALYQTGQFGPEQTLYVWYILIGSTVGLLAMTLGRLYSSAFYALRDTRTPLRFAVARVALTGILGYLFAFPLRWIIVDAIALLHMRLPALPGGSATMGTVGLTASAGIAGWLEFLLLRQSMQKRIGAVSFPASYQVRVWSSAVAAGVAALAFDVFIAGDVSKSLPLLHVAEAAMVCAVFGIVYFGMAMLLGVPEAKATVARLRR
jgi:putative peptidoglycan lipid II flippase